MSTTYPDVDATSEFEPVLPENHFAELYRINVSEHVEKKGRFSYLSWPYAVAELSKRYPNASWEVKRFDGLPYLKAECGYFVEVSVTVNGVERSQIHPILDNNNRPIKVPTSFDVNTSIQRALVKAIGLHGLGLYIYAGEDLPEGEEAEPAYEPSYTDKQKRAFDAMLAAGDSLGIALLEQSSNAQQWTDLYNSGERGQKVKMKQAADAMHKEGKTVMQYIADAIAKNDSLMAREAIDGALPGTVVMAKSHWPELAELLESHEGTE